MNNRTVNYTISLDGFRYHVKKGVLRKGSTVSKRTHPLVEVENYKLYLIASGLLKDEEDYYVCKHDIHTGLMMAYNLHCGDLKKDLVNNKSITINGSNADSEIKDYFELNGVISADNTFNNIIHKDCIKKEKLIPIEYNNEFFKNKRDGSFSMVEQFVVDALYTAGIISDFRRGNPQNKEADIIDIVSNRQIEIVSLLDDKIPSQFREKDSTSGHYAMLLEYTNPESFIVSDGVIRKFTERTYTERYHKELAIYMLGTRHEAVAKSERLISELECKVNDIRNYYKNTYLVIHDPLVEEEFMVINKTSLLSYRDDLCSTNIVKRGKEVNVIANDEDMYFLIEKNIFTGNKGIYILKGKELKDWSLSRKYL